jgi:hypothetical protein
VPSPVRDSYAPAVSWDPRFGIGDRAFESVDAAAKRLRRFSAWPSVEDIDRALADLVAPIRFVVQAPKTRRRRGPVDAALLYDGRISVEGVVPTRARSWHDLLNALVWASFPKSKRALHARQHRAMCARIGASIRRLPNARTREQDLLAMLDEGGVLTIVGSDGFEQRFVFGHAILEHRLAGLDARPRDISLRSDAVLPPTLDARRALADALLTTWLEQGGS